MRKVGIEGMLINYFRRKWNGGLILLAADSSSISPNVVIVVVCLSVYQFEKLLR